MVRDTLVKSVVLTKRITEVLDVAEKMDSLTKKEKKTLEDLKKYRDYMVKFTDQIERRLIERDSVAEAP